LNPDSPELDTVLKPLEISSQFVRRITMAKMKKRKFRWEGSNSSQIVGYKLYWSEWGGVDYDSKCAELGNVTEVVLPDDVDAFTPANGPVEFGLTAIDELGNESDMVTVYAPYQFSVPEMPENLVIETIQEFHVHHNPDDDSDESEDQDPNIAEFPKKRLKTA
jgi:hypothetical protein